MTGDRTPREPTKEEVAGLPGPVVLEFGAHWCGFCQALHPRLTALLAEFPGVRHIQVEDGPGRPLGRAFRVKLWPTLVFLKDGQEVAKAVRPWDDDIRRGLEAVTGTGAAEPAARES